MLNLVYWDTYFLFAGNVPMVVSFTFPEIGEVIYEASTKGNARINLW